MYRMDREELKNKLYQLYVIERKPVIEIAEILGLVKTTVQQYLSNFKIKRGYSKSSERKINVDKMVELYKDGKSTYEIASILKYSPTTIQKNLKERGINLSIKKDITGLVFGRLIVLEEIDSEHCLCQCDCGKEKICKRKRLLDGRNTSCGCRMTKKGKDNGMWTGYKDISGTYWNSIRHGAINRGINFEITQKDAWDLYVLQEKKCAISRIDILLPTSREEKVPTKYEISNLASLDRIDSSIGYINGNIQWVLREINIMKNNLDQSLFINLCKIISKEA